MALGSTSNDFNTPGVKEHCIFLDNPHQARRFHQEMLNLFLKYTSNMGANGKVNIAIVGGGATGVELSAELHNAVKQLHSYGYKGLTNEALNVTLVEAGERILPALPPRISGAAHNELTKLGVRVLTQTMVTSADEGGLHTKDGEYIKADLMVWAAGIKAPDFMKISAAWKPTALISWSRSQRCKPRVTLKSLLSVTVPPAPVLKVDSCRRAPRLHTRWQAWSCTTFWRSTKASQ